MAVLIRIPYLQIMTRASYFVGFLILFSSCQPAKQEDSATFEVFCEMVASDAKPISLHHPMDSSYVDTYWPVYEKRAKKWGVSLYRETAFPNSLLFPEPVKDGQHVVLIYLPPRLQQYLQWKTDQLAADPADRGQQEALARRLGRLLGYGHEGVNRLLEKNSGYRSLASFGVSEQITHLYYEIPGEAIAFYEGVLGLPKEGANRFRIGADALIEIHPFGADHPSGQPKSTAIALLTDQLPEWYAYIQSKNIPVKYPYRRREGGPHDGFVALDPGGYLLEFEAFKQHPENERLMAVLAEAPRTKTGTDGLYFFGSITWTYHKDLSGMQQFYEETLGYPLVADQGWTKIYRTSPTGFIGLVDERRGMEDYADQKAVELEWRVQDLQGLAAHASDSWSGYDKATLSLTGPEGYRYRISEKTSED
ncbi:MAG: VOC family protein [Robiginitalea sp.]|jgi:catechol 2,3-dioxygenase-like lactoylglutathione lyase family enzyme